MDLLEHAKMELELLERNCEDDEAIEMQKMVTKDVMQVLDVLCKQGHTALSASYTMDKIKRLWEYKPLIPLTGEDDEWEGKDNWVILDEHNSRNKKFYQNKRCCGVFKDKETGRAYYSDGYAYCEPNSDAYFTCRESRKYITFPCNPNELRTEYRKLLFPSKYVPIKWANRLHLYKTGGNRG